MNDLATPTFTENSRRIFDLRYPRKDEHGEPAETPERTIDRVASNVASVSGLYSEGDKVSRGIGESERWPHRTAMRQHRWLSKKNGTDVEFAQALDYPVIEETAQRYYDLIASWDFLPNSPTWTGAGTPLGQLAACFVLPIDDDLATGRASIFETMKVAALIQQTGGGNGFSFSRLRPSKSIVTRSMGQASGPVGFLQAYDAAFGVIAQGGSRRGANMGVLVVHHPDISSFSVSKTEEGKVANFNISIALTDEFMEAVAKDADFDLRWTPQGPTDDPVTYEIHRTIKARDLWDEITKNAWVIGDPGNLFIDRANRDNPVPTRYTLEATNPCGEQWLGPYENCCLGSISVNHFASWDGTFDWERFRQVVETSTQFLDDVVDANQYVEAVPELEEAAQGGRRIGLGLMGLADAMLMMGIRYGSEEGIEFASQVTEFARYHCMKTSVKRARDRGPFEWFENSIYDLNNPEPLIGLDGKVHDRWTPPTPLVSHTTDWGRPSLDWALLTAWIKEHGIRNSCQFTFAPTGTISNVAALEGSGCEPLFALTYVRTVMQEGQNIQLTYASPLFAEALRREGFGDEDIATITELVKENGGSCQDVLVVPEAVRRTFVVAGDVTWEEHVRTQAALQRFVDNSISKTINMPNSATVEDVGAAYRLAYDLGCKGITIYRQGSRELEVLSTGTKGDVQIQENAWPTIHPMPLPSNAEEDGIPARIFPVVTPFGKVQVAITEIEGHPGRPFDVRLQSGKAGNDKNADVEALGRMISVALRAGIAVEEVVDQLEHIGGSTVTGFGERKVRSVADGVAKLLKRRYITGSEFSDVQFVTETVTVTKAAEQPVHDPNLVCPLCKNATLVMISGCRHCEINMGGCGKYSGCE